MWLIDFILHFDRHLDEVIRNYGTLAYGFLFAIVFAETGLVFLPLLPGDSLLFAAGTLSSGGSLHVGWLAGSLIVAAVGGDTVNYHLGKWFGLRMPFVNQKHLDRTRAYFEKYGAKTIILARFVPIVRTFAPFVAGMGTMNYGRFLLYNVLGGVVWVLLFVFAGYWFGTRPWVKENFTHVILAIIVISVLPMVFEAISHWLQARKAAAATAPPLVATSQAAEHAESLDRK